MWQSQRMRPLHQPSASSWTAVRNGTGGQDAHKALQSPLMTGGVEAMLVPDGFNAEKLVDEGWAQLHANLLVAGL